MRWLFFSCFVFLCYLGYSQSDDLELIVENHSTSRFSISAYVQNNGSESVSVPVLDRSSFWGLGRNASIYFTLEEFKNGKWEKIDYDVYSNKTCITGFHQPLSLQKILPGEKEKIGSHSIYSLASWFGFYGPRKLRLSLAYKVNPSENLSLFPEGIELISKPIVFNYFDPRRPVDFLKYTDSLKQSGQLSKKNFKKRAKTVYKTNSEMQLFIDTFKKYGLNSKDIEKIDSLYLETTCDEKPFVITTYVVRNKAKYYLMMFVRYTRYGLEKRYSRDFVKLYHL